MADAETFDIDYLIKWLNLNPRMLFTLVFKKMLYDNSRKMGNPVTFALALCTKAKIVKKLHRVLISSFRYIYIVRLSLQI